MKLQKLWLSLLTLVLSAGTLALAQGPGDKLAFRYNPSGKDSCLMNAKVQTLVTQRIEGYKVTRSQIVELLLNLRITDPDSTGIVTVNVKIDSVAAGIRTPFETQEFTTQNPVVSLEPSVQGIAALNGKTFKIRLGPKGASLDPVNRVNTATSDPFGVARVSLWEDSFATMLTNLLNLLPPAEVASKDAWKKLLTLPSENLPVSVEAGLQYLQTTEGAAVFSVFGPVTQTVKNTVNLKGSGKESVKSEVFTTLAGTVRGVAEVGVKNGLLKRASLISVLVGEVKRLDSSIPFNLEIKLDLQTIPTL